MRYDNIQQRHRHRRRYDTRINTVISYSKIFKCQTMEIQIPNREKNTRKQVDVLLTVILTERRAKKKTIFYVQLLTRAQHRRCQKGENKSEAFESWMALFSLFFSRSIESHLTWCRLHVFIRRLWLWLITIKRWTNGKINENTMFFNVFYCILFSIVFSFTFQNTVVFIARTEKGNVCCSITSCYLQPQNDVDCLLCLRACLTLLMPWCIQTNNGRCFHRWRWWRWRCKTTLI